VGKRERGIESDPKTVKTRTIRSHKKVIEEKRINLEATEATFLKAYAFFFSH